MSFLHLKYPIGSSKLAAAALGIPLQLLMRHLKFLYTFDNLSVHDDFSSKLFHLFKVNISAVIPATYLPLSHFIVHLYYLLSFDSFPWSEFRIIILSIS